MSAKCYSGQKISLKIGVKCQKESMVILESAQDGLLHSNLLLNMYLMSLKHNGALMPGDGLPQTLANISGLSSEEVWKNPQFTFEP
ncbi:hypothetical protein D5282_19880 [bacterium 1xD8-48]|nr:hypothetical protein [bacterium 1xD8-48]